MLDHGKALAALEAKKDRFHHFLQTRRQERSRLEEQFGRLRESTLQEIQEVLLPLDKAWPGALPTTEQDRAQDFCLPFIQGWTDHRQARSWALETLTDRPVIAVDGSQLPPSKDFSIPVAAVQVGWFINAHTAGSGGYVKDIEFEVVAPDELDDEDDGAGIGFPSWQVNQVRFVRECQKLCQLISEFAGAPAEQKPLCFFDGSFIISFAGQLRPERATPYIEAVTALLACSQRYRVPIVGFVDSSYSRDLVTLMANLAGFSSVPQISDASLCGEVLPGWGDRSPLYVCARSDGLSNPPGQSGRAGFYREVGFTYMRLTADRPPVRLELPLWVLEEDRVDQVMNLVRGECVVGNGYPYALETADAVAVIGAQDRQRFYALFQQFAQREGLRVSMARKAVSKQERR